MKEIRLNKSYNSSFTTLVDDSDYDWLNQYSWSLMGDSKSDLQRAATSERGPNGKRKTVLMHRLIMGFPDGMQVDHIDGNGLNNQRSNLRIVTARQNLSNRRRFENNTSGLKCVHFEKETGLWRLRFSASFATKEEASDAYNRVASMIFGEYARLN